VQPTDLVKVRFQSEGRLAPGQAPRYAGVLDAYRTILRTEGLAGLWTGLGPNIARNSIINATELASYDTAKELLLGPAVGLREGLPVHVAAATFAGAMATLLGNPVDVIKTRVMAAQRQAASGGGGGGAAAPEYRGAIDCLVRTLRSEGPGALYQGVTPQFVRITGWNIVMFVTFEQLKKAAGEHFARPQAQ
jgi:solute carrier family 25 uncoupling protein 8/9